MPKGSGTTFGAWLLKQANRNDPVGMLAADYATPCACPACDGRASRRYSVAGVREELARHGAKDKAFGALEAAAAEWRQVTGAAA